MLHLAEMSPDAVPNAQIVGIQKRLSNGSAWCISYCYITCSITVQLKCSATEHFNYDPKANLSNGSRQAHAVFTCLTAPPFVQRLSPGHTAGDLAAVTCDPMHRVHFCMGHLCIAPTMHIQQGPHDHPPG
ncbi:hypothetical protein O181_108712 [Austropuccinia psidii MF-1]|uniref:Uncharacterized protein n=1 Tax=Austropuccinia psidii MF-1 TaxID=1389203 RepID=A0A9Q3JWF3_9BASI|nr:hypothetical protein [Austropuccinia psidii MF-1]